MRTLEKLTLSLLLFFSSGFAWAADSDFIAEYETLIGVMFAHPANFEISGQAKIREKIIHNNRQFVTKAFRQSTLNEIQWRAVVLVIVMNSEYDQLYDLMHDNQARLLSDRPRLMRVLTLLTEEHTITNQTMAAVLFSLDVAFAESRRGNDRR